MKIRICYPDNLAGERHSNPHLDQKDEIRLEVETCTTIRDIARLSGVSVGVERHRSERVHAIDFLLTSTTEGLALHLRTPNAYRT
jgi:hypothetical protein